MQGCRNTKSTKDYHSSDCSKLQGIYTAMPPACSHLCTAHSVMSSLALECHVHHHLGYDIKAQPPFQRDMLHQQGLVWDWCGP